MMFARQMREMEWRISPPAVTHFDTEVSSYPPAYRRGNHQLLSSILNRSLYSSARGCHCWLVCSWLSMLDLSKSLKSSFPIDWWITESSQFEISSVDSIKVGSNTITIPHQLYLVRPSKTSWAIEIIRRSYWCSGWWCNWVEGAFWILKLKFEIILDSWHYNREVLSDKRQANRFNIDGALSNAENYSRDFVLLLRQYYSSTDWSKRMTMQLMLCPCL